MAVLIESVPSAHYVFSPTQLVIEVPFQYLTPNHVRLYYLNEGEMTPIDYTKYEVKRGQEIHLKSDMLPAGTDFYARREVALTQPWDSTGITHIKPSEFERAMDRIIMAAQELRQRELFNYVTLKTQSLGYIQKQQGWLLGEDGTADISGNFHGYANITDGIIDGRTVEILGVTTHRQYMQGFADANLGSVDTPNVDGVDIRGAGRTIFISVFITKLFGGIRRFHAQISKDAEIWYALPDNPSREDPDSWKGEGGGFTTIEGVNYQITELPFDHEEDSPVDTTYYIRIRGARWDDFVTAWTPAQAATIKPTGPDDLVAGAITAEAIQVDVLSTLSANMGVLTAGEIRSPGGELLIDLSHNSIGVGALSGRGLSADGEQIFFNGTIRADYLAPTGRDWDGGSATSSFTDYEIDGGTAFSGTNYFNLFADDRTGSRTGPQFHSVVVDSSLFIAEKLQIGDYQNGQGILWDGSTLSVKGSGNFTGNISASTISGSAISGSTVSGASITGGSININNVFTVDSSGSVAAGNLNLTGGTISGNITMTGSLQGGQIQTTDTSNRGTFIDSVSASFGRHLTSGGGVGIGWGSQMSTLIWTYSTQLFIDGGTGTSLRVNIPLTAASSASFQGPVFINLSALPQSASEAAPGQVFRNGQDLRIKVP